MKNQILTTLCIAFLLFTACARKRGTSNEWQKVGRVGEVEIAAEVHGASTNYVMSFRKGCYVFSVISNSISAGSAGERTVASLTFSPTNTDQFRMVLTRQGTGGTERLMDFNGDGMPDKKVVANPSETFLFFGGAFYKTVYEHGTNYVLKAGIKIPVLFDGQQWQNVSEKSP